MIGTAVLQWIGITWSGALMSLAAIAMFFS